MAKRTTVIVIATVMLTMVILSIYGKFERQKPKDDFGFYVDEQFIPYRNYDMAIRSGYYE